MIIEKNNPIQKQPFKVPNNSISNSNNNYKLYNKSQSLNTTNTNEMANNSLAILQERLLDGSITIEEFNQKAKMINDSRK